MFCTLLKNVLVYILLCFIMFYFKRFLANKITSIVYFKYDYETPKIGPKIVKYVLQFNVKLFTDGLNNQTSIET